MNLLHSLGQLIGGRLCEVCGHSLPKGRVAICTGCLAAISRTNLHRAIPNALSELASNAVAPVLLASAWMFYDPDSTSANLIRVGKYGNRPAYMRALGRIYGGELMDEIPSEINKIDVILPIPMHPQKELRRGYNQAHEVAQGIADATGVVVGDNLRLLRRKDTQTHHNRAERSQNVRHIFTLDRPHELHGLNVAVVDDVITTGATLTEAILAIGHCGARPASISILALAHRRPD